MPDLHDRFRALDAIPTPHLWDEIELRAEQPLERPQPSSVPVFGISVALVVVAILALAVLLPGGQGIGTDESSSELPTASPAASESVRPFGDPTYMGSDHSTWPVRAEWTEGSFTHQIRADWVGDEFCYEAIEIVGSAISGGSGDCFTQGELSQAPVVGIGQSWGPQIGDESVIGIVTRSDIVEIEVALQSGAVLTPELIPVPHDLWPMALVHAEIYEDPMRRLSAFDAQGLELFSVALRRGP